MKKYYFFSLVMAAVFGVPSLSFADFTITPSITVNEKYNDNLFLTRTDREDDFITRISPAITLEYRPSTYFDMSLDYGFNFRFYADHNELDDTSLSETQFADLTAQVRPLDRVFIDITDVYRRVRVDVRERTAPDNDITNMTDSNDFMISPYVELPLTSTLLSRFGYRYINKWYRVDEGNDADGNGAFATVNHTYPFGLTVSLNYDFLAYRPEITSDYDRHSGKISATYQAGPYLIIQGGYGKSYIDLADASSERTDIWNAEADYRIAALGDATLGVHYDSSLSEGKIDAVSVSEVSERGTLAVDDGISVTAGIMKTRRLDLIFSVRNEYKVTINPFYMRDEELETDREDKITGVYADTSKPLTDNLTGRIDVRWERQKFLPEDEKVRFYSLGSSIDYLMSRSITTSAGYRYNNRNSNIDSGDYHNNIVWLEAKVTF